MPMLDLGDWPNCSMAVSAHRILATMLYPRVEEHAQRQELQTALDAEQIFSMDCVEQARLCTTEPERVFTLLRLPVRANKNWFWRIKKRVQHRCLAALP
jgi:hypothetical protein